MRIPLIVLGLTGCLPLSNSHLGIDALGPPKDHVRVSGGIGTVTSENTEDFVAFGAQAEVALGERASVFGSTTSDLDLSFSNSRIGGRYRVTDDDSPVAVAPFGGVVLVGYRDFFTDEPLLIGGAFVGAVMTGDPIDELRLSLGGSLGNVRFEGGNLTTGLVAGRASIRMTPKFSLDVEPGLQLALGEGSEVYPAILIGLSGDISTRSSGE